MNFEIVLATNNKHKLQEVREILSPHGIIVYSPNDLNLKIDDVEETGTTYYENALIKANNVAKATSFPVIADDSGLEIEGMNNEPGIYSARYAEKCGGHQEAFKIIFENIKDKTRNAKFICDIVLVNTEDKPLLFEGVVNGHIAKTPEGDNGFGYDPIFIADEYNKCYALMSKEEKNKGSHRAKALIKLLTYLRLNGFINK